MMIDIGLAFIIGLMIGLVLKPKDKDLKEQQDIYVTRYREYEATIKYYKDLCKWHVEQRKTNDQTKGS